MSLQELGSRHKIECNQALFQVNYYNSCESRVMKLNRTIALNVCLKGQCKEKRPGKVQ